MKKFALVTFSLLLIGTLGLIINITLVKAHPEIIYVDDDNITGPWDGTPEQPYQNITSGLAHATNGDTIFVYNGTYTERLIIDKPISLIGQNKHNTIIDGNRTGTVIEVTANNVSITEFTIKNSGLFHYKLCGMYLEKISNSNISHNIITYNYKGIHVVNSSHNIFTGNEISKNLEAIYTTNSNNSIFTTNTFSNNEFAIVTTSSSNNTAFHNNFINNTHFISSIDSTNYWDNGMEGNYWSDYNGRDEDQDGIGESPYIIDANNQDNHPLMGTFSDFTIIYEEETYHTFTICNSTISQFQFNETFRMLNFNVTGVNDTAGFCRIMIPEQLTHRPHIVFVDNEQVNATSLPISNVTHTSLYFAYNHTTQEVKILSKPYYELVEKYTTLLEDYRNLNSTYYQLLTDYESLDQIYQQLLADYDSLNKTYWQVLTNYTQLQADYNSLNQTYQETLTNYTTLKNEYHSLSEEYGLLNQTYQQVLANYTELLAKHHSLNQTYQELMANHTKLQNDYNSIQTDHNALLEQYNSLNSTYNKIESEYVNTQIALWCVSAAAVAITAITSSIIIKYGKRSKEQEKLLKKYKNELERISLLDIARTQFETDVQRRKEKIEKFKNKYGITVRPRNTLEDVIRSLELKRKKEN
jgi:parallel beta-helix repeat protein